MKKIICVLIVLNMFSVYCFSQTVNSKTVTIEITNVVINGGIVYLAVFSNAQAFRREEPDFSFAIAANNTSIFQSVTLSYGEYVIAAFQDANGNGIMDSNFFGIPRELVGISNYSGRGFPSNNFDRQKIPVGSTTDRITIGLYRF